MTTRVRKSAEEALDPTPEGEALYELVVQLPPLAAQLQASARRGDATAIWGGALWGLLRGLKLDGPRTVPQIARSRDVARQRIQSLADVAARDGLVAFRDNPDHRRSPLLSLTSKGHAAFDEIDSRLRREVERLARNMDIRDLDSALRVFFDLSERLRRRRR